MDSSTPASTEVPGRPSGTNVAGSRQLATTVARSTRVYRSVARALIKSSVAITTCTPPEAV